MELENLKGPKYTIEMSQWYDDEKDEYKWHWALGMYLTYECACNNCENYAHGNEHADFSVSLREAIKAFDDSFGKDEKFRLVIHQNMEIECE
jgi:hypothetical protein